jgi:hypothetical protein
LAVEDHVKRRGPSLVSATKRVRATNARRRLAQRAIDIDTEGRVVGLAPEMMLGAPSDDASAQLDRRGPGIYPDKGDLDAVARWIASVALVPVEVVLAIVRKLEGLPKFLLVGYVLFYLTRDEHRRSRARR